MGSEEIGPYDGRKNDIENVDGEKRRWTTTKGMTARTKNASLHWGRQSDGMKRKAFNSDDQRLSALIKHSAARSTAATLKLGSKRGYAWDIGPRLNSWLDTFHGLPSVALWRATLKGTPTTILTLLPLSESNWRPPLLGFSQTILYRQQGRVCGCALSCVLSFSSPVSPVSPVSPSFLVNRAPALKHFYIYRRSRDTQEREWADKDKRERERERERKRNRRADYYPPTQKGPPLTMPNAANGWSICSASAQGPSVYTATRKHNTHPLTHSPTFLSLSLSLTLFYFPISICVSSCIVFSARVGSSSAVWRYKMTSTLASRSLPLVCRHPVLVGAVIYWWQIVIVLGSWPTLK